MRKKIISLLFTVLFVGTLFSNIAYDYISPTDTSSSLVDKTAALLLIDEGKQMFNQGRTRDALTKFREANIRDERNYKALFWIAKTHYQLSNFGYALKYARSAAKIKNEMDGDVYFLLGQAYHRTGVIDSAEVLYELANEHLSNAKKKMYKLDFLREEIAFAKKFSDADISYKKKLLEGDINSGYPDYGAVLTPDRNTMYFVSRRPDTKGGNLNPQDQSYFEDIYRATWNSEINRWDSITNDVERLNSSGFDAVGHISHDGNWAYLTVNTSITDLKKTTRGSDICYSEFTSQGRWSKPKCFKNKSINTSYFDGSPTLTGDENTMYFVSDRKGEKSMSDIYVVHRDGRNWGEAYPLPEKINSKGNETTPYITPDGEYLFFSSDGLVGMGGYDIFVSKNLGNNEWSDPINLGPEFNSVNDDTHFRYYEDLARAYLSTYHIQGKKASIDIYQIELEGWTIPFVEEKKEHKKIEAKEIKSAE